jgi:signal transduction histidine kinase
VAASLRGSTTLRARLLAALVLVALVPMVGLSLALTRTIASSYAEMADRRLSFATSAVRARLDQMQALAESKVTAVALQELPAARVDDGATLATPGVLATDLPVLEVLDDGGRVISSRQWPAGEGLPAAEGTFPPDDALRILKVAAGYGARDQLAVTASHASRWGGGAVEVRGGYLLDEVFLSSLSTPLGMTVGLRDEVHGSWWTEPRSPLASWRDVRLGSGRGEVGLPDGRYRWASTPLRPGLSAVVAAPVAEVEALSRSVGRLSALATASAMLVAVAAALWLSGRIARPVRRLAEALSGVGRGYGAEMVPEEGPTEMRELARAFNGMTAELRESRDRLLQAERVAAWREMARRLAHELKNPLFPIQVSIETLRRAAEQEHVAERARTFSTLLEESCDTILEELRLLRGIIDEFSGFARLPRPRFAATDVNAVVEQVLALHRVRAGSVEISVDLALDLPPIPADRDLLAHALGNLVANALDAMPDGGSLRVETTPGVGGVTVSVADSGPGIPEEQRARLFTPYFTTKKGGTGLGLSIAQSVVSDHGGRIDVRTAAGEGTTFRLFLPGSPGPGGAVKEAVAGGGMP